MKQWPHGKNLYSQWQLGSIQTYVKGYSHILPIYVTAWTSWQIRKIPVRMRRECRERFPRQRRWAIPTCITARASRTCRDACRDRWLAVSFEMGAGGKRSRHSRRMRNLQFYISGKRPIYPICHSPEWHICRWSDTCHMSHVNPAGAHSKNKQKYKQCSKWSEICRKASYVFVGVDLSFCLSVSSSVCLSVSLWSPPLLLWLVALTLTVFPGVIW